MVVFGIVAGWFLSAGICSGAGADGVGCFFVGDRGFVVGGGSVWKGGAKIPVEDEFGRMV